MVNHRKHEGAELMSQETKRDDEVANDQARDNEENELEAEQESAEAMDAEVPQPTGADQTTEGQPS
jgi:hypothetical protein